MSQLNAVENQVQLFENKLGRMICALFLLHFPKTFPKFLFKPDRDAVAENRKRNLVRTQNIFGICNNSVSLSCTLDLYKSDRRHHTLLYYMFVLFAQFDSPLNVVVLLHSIIAKQFSKLACKKLRRMCTGFYFSLAHLVRENLHKREKSLFLFYSNNTVDKDFEIGFSILQRTHSVELYLAAAEHMKNGSCVDKDAINDFFLAKKKFGSAQMQNGKHAESDI